MAGRWTEDLHPRSHGEFAKKGTAPVSRMADVKVSAGRPAGMTDAQFHERAARVTEVMGEAMKTHATDMTHTDQHGQWTSERNALHHEIANHLYHKHGSHVPNEGKALVAGGLGGAGKSTVLNKHMGLDTEKNFLTLNPDEVKEEMARRGLIPDVPGHHDLTPLERSALVHEESSRITHLIADKAYREKKNVMWDITMSNHKSAKARLDDLDKHGYRDTHGVFVDIPVDKSVDRAMSRYRRGIDSFHNGEGYGGRFVPPAIIRKQQAPHGGSINKDTFDSLTHRFGKTDVFDNSVDGREPARIPAATSKDRLDVTRSRDATRSVRSLH